MRKTTDGTRLLKVKVFGGLVRCRNGNVHDFIEEAELPIIKRCLPAKGYFSARYKDKDYQVLGGIGKASYILLNRPIWSPA